MKACEMGDDANWDMYTLLAKEAKLKVAEELVTNLQKAYNEGNLEEVFEAAIIEVGDDGTLVVRDRKGMISEYRFKEIELVL